MICLPNTLSETTEPRVQPTWLGPSIRTVLACVTLSKRSAAIVAEASYLARLCGAELQVVHAGADTSQARQRLRMALSAANVPLSTPASIRAGRSDRVICDTATRIGADLIVAGVLSKDATLAEHADSTAGRLVVAAPCSVLLIRDPGTRPTPPRRVMATVGFDLTSRAMLEWATQWARGLGVEKFDVVHEYDPRAFYAQPDAEHVESQLARNPRSVAALRREALEHMLRSYDWSDLKQTQICLRSNSGCDALWYARLMGADLLCIPVTPRRLTFWSRLIGHRLAVDLHELPCPVLFFKP